MFKNHDYVNEKLRAFQIETLEARSSRPSELIPRRRIGGALVSAAGRALNRIGEGIERWARTENAPREPSRFGSSVDPEQCEGC